MSKIIGLNFHLFFSQLQMMADVVAIQNNSNNNISEAVAILNKVEKKINRIDWIRASIIY